VTAQVEPSERDASDPAASGAEDPRGVVRRGLGVARRYARAEPWVFTGSIVGATLFSLLLVLTTVVIGRIVDEVLEPAFTTGTTADDVRVAALALTALGVARALSIVLRRFLAGVLQFRVQRTWRGRISDAYVDTSLSYVQGRPTGELLAHADADVMAATGMLAPLPFSVGIVALVVFAVVSLFAIDPWFALAASTIFPVLGVVNHVYTTRIEQPMAETQRRVGEVSRIAHESFDGALAVKTLGRRDAEVERLDAAAEQLRLVRVRVGRIRAVFEPALDTVTYVASIALVLLGAWLIDAGRITTGELVQGMAVFGLLFFPIRVFGYFLQELPRSVVGTDRLDAAEAGARADVVPTDGTTALPPGPLPVEVDRVSFAYERGSAVLRDVSFTVSPGEIVAVVGATGSGKSTLCDLVAHLAEPDAGVVRVGGVAVADVEPGALRAAVALVFQEAFLFADTVAANIDLDGTATPEAIRRAARRARADRFVAALPDGFDTVVGERGVTLSGGQRQRLCLARALVREPRVLLLDDATSAVDPVIEAEILAELRGSLDATTLIVAHRVSTIALADRVVFLAGGRVVATGTHDELLALAAYERIVRAYESETG
jgi:ABC-type multidrug transport system fused ATPase/permease subunit